jgi:hypothetical protein
MLPEAVKFKKDWKKQQRARVKSGVERDSYVYLHLNADDDQPHHVGIGHTVGRPWDMGLRNRNRKHHNKVAAHGVRVEIIDADMTWDTAQFWEIAWIKALKTNGYALTNLTEGGDGVTGLRGELNPYAKLTEEQAREILTSPEKNLEISARLGVGYYAVWEIRAGHSWTHLPAPTEELLARWKNRTGSKGHKKSDAEKRVLSLQKQGAKSVTAKISEETALEILASPEKNLEISARLNVSARLIADIRRRRTWKHLPAADPAIAAHWVDSRGGRNRSAILTEAQVREILSSAETTTALAEKYNVSYHTIRLIRKRLIWRHLDLDEAT